VTENREKAENGSPKQGLGDRKQRKSRKRAHQSRVLVTEKRENAKNRSPKQVLDDRKQRKSRKEVTKEGSW
jgi:hypothetical protein